MGFNRAKQVVLDHWKKPKRVWSPPADPPPASYDHDHRFNGFFFDAFPNGKGEMCQKFNRQVLNPSH